MLHYPHERNGQSPQTPDYRIRRSLCRLALAAADSMDTAAPLRSDLLFEVMDENGRLQLLHHELQGRTSHKPMPYRKLQQILLALFDAENTAVILDLIRNLENGRGAEK